jgi:AraC-like DNA-binding protein
LANRFINLEDFWGSEARSLRDQLCELSSPQLRLTCFEAFLRRKLDDRTSRSVFNPHPAVCFALHCFRRVPSAISVAEVARGTGWSERRVTQLFREQVGLTPKVWCRIQRFQHAVRQLYAGVDIPWGDLALDCGYYDQSHFANEFRAFSGIDITTYSVAGRTLWANHVLES